MGNEIRILMLEDNPDDADLNQRELRKGGIAFTCRRVDTEADFTRAIEEFKPDLILADYTLPTFNGLRALEIVLRKHVAAPFIFVSGTLGEDIAVDAVKRGATDYVTKSRLGHLVPSVIHALRGSEERAKRQDAEDQLAMRNSELQAIFHAFPDVYFRTDADGVILSYHASRLCGFQLPIEAVIGTKLHEAFGHHSRERFHEAIQKVLGTNSPARVDTPLVVAGGQKVFEARILPLPKRQTLVIFRDITEQKAAEMSLDRLGRQSRAILDSAGEGIIGLDLAGKHTFANAAAAQMLGHEAKDLVGLSAHATWHHSRPDGTPYPEEESPISAALRDKSSKHVDTEVFWRKDGASFPVEYIATPIRDKDRLVGVVVVFRDITERKKAEQAIRESYEKLKRMMEATIKVITHMVEMKDPYLVGHGRRVAKLAKAIARELGFPEERAECTRIAAYLHDLGMIFTPAEILRKPGKLQSHEFDIVKAHSQAGFDILKGLEFPPVVAQAVAQHHERMNGKGYPLGLVGENIIIEARIIGVADVVESMTNPRSYRKALGLEKTLEELALHRSVLYDARVVDICVRLLKEGF